MIIKDAETKAFGQQAQADTTIQDEVGFFEALPAAFNLENSVFSTIANKVTESPFDPDYDPIAKIPVGNEIHATRYARANSDSDVESINKQIEREKKDRELIARAGGDGMLALFTAGALDPINLIPIGGTAIRTAKTGKAAIETAKAGAVSTAVAETFLQSTQETRTAQESALAITAGTFIGGLIGAGAHKLLGQVEGTRPIQDIEVDVDRSVGAAQATEIEVLNNIAGGKLTQKAIKIQGIVDPSIRLMSSAREETSKAAEKLMETPLKLAKNEFGIATEQSAEAIARSYDADLFGFLRGLDDDYTQYTLGRNKQFGDKVRLGIGNMAGADRMSFADFKAAVGKAARRGDSADDLPVPDAAKPHIAKAAQRYRKMADKLKNDAIAAKLLPEDVDVETAATYLNRVYRTELLATPAARMRFKDTVATWLRQSNDDLNDGQIDSMAEDILMNIEGLPDGRLARDIDSDFDRPRSTGGRGDAKKGTFKKRSFLIPDEMIEEFLEDDIEYLARSLTRNMAPDIGIAKAFDTNDVSLEAQINDIRKSWEAEIEAAGGDQNLKKKMDREIEDFVAVRDRIRGTFGLPKDPKAWGPRVGRSLRTLSYIRLLGGMTLSAIPDLGRTVMVNGMTNTFKDFAVPMLTNISAIKTVNRELKDMGVVAEILNNTRAQAFADLTDNFARQSAVEKGLGAMSDTFGMVSLMSPWNDALKTMAGAVTQSRLIRAIRAEANGTIDAKDLEFLRANGIGADDIPQLAGEISSHGSSIRGYELPNWQAWTNRDAKDKFERAINREVRKTIVTPGQDRALIAVGDRTMIDQSTEVGKMMLQFKAFGIAAGQRMLISGMQQKDMATLNGVLLTVALGMMTYGIKEKVAGRETPDPNENFSKWMVEGVDRSGLLGWLTEPNNIVEKMTRGNIGLSAIAGDAPMSRYASRSIPEAVLGPVLGLAGDLAGATSGVATAATGGEGMNKSDIHTLRKVLPYQNVFYLRHLFDEVEAAAVEASE